MIDQGQTPQVALRLAIDTGPLHGARTGIGVAVDALVGELASRNTVALHPYVTSYRAQLTPGTQRLPLPAALAHRTWARVGFPRVDRWLGDVDVVHGTNYVVPPSRLPSVVTVYDCWFLRNERDAAPAVRHAGGVLRASVRRGAMVHTSSHATEQAVRDLLHTDRVRTVHGRIVASDLDARTVTVEGADGTTTVEPYDVLVVATGTSNGFWRHDRVEGVDAVDLIQSGEVDLIVNTPRGRGPRADGDHIRMAATRSKVPCLTTVAAALAAAAGIAEMTTREPAVHSLQEYHLDAQLRFGV